MYPEPYGLSFSIANMEKKLAIRTIEKYLTWTYYILVAGAELLNKAKDILENKELEE